MRGDGDGAVFHKEYLLHLREQLEPVGEVEKRAVRAQGADVGKHLPLRIPVQCGEGVIEHVQGAVQGERPCQGEALLLPAGETVSGGADPRVDPLLHGCHLLVETDRLQIGHHILLPSKEHVVLNRAVKELRVMAEVPDDAVSLLWGETAKVLPVPGDGAGTGRLKEKCPAKR